jgi:hypothetical protein
MRRDKLLKIAEKGTRGRASRYWFIEPTTTPRRTVSVPDWLMAEESLGSSKDCT